MKIVSILLQYVFITSQTTFAYFFCCSHIFTLVSNTVDCCISILQCTLSGTEDC